MAIRTIGELADAAERDPALHARVKADPTGTLKTLADQGAYFKDPWFYRIAILALALVVIIAALGAIIIAVQNPHNYTVPTVITALGSAALGGLVGLFAPPPGTAK